MKALTIWQPWATLCVHPDEVDPSRPVKRYETRGWRTKHRGPLAIHASARWTQALADMCKEPLFARHLGRLGYSVQLSPRGGLPFSAVVGVVDVVECESVVYARSEADEAELRLGDFSHGRFAWRLANPTPLPVPIPCNGRQGLWTLNQITVEEIGRQLRRRAS